MGPDMAQIWLIWKVQFGKEVPNYFDVWRFGNPGRSWLTVTLICKCYNIKMQLFVQ